MSAIHHLPQRHPPINPSSNLRAGSRSPHLSEQPISGQPMSGRPVAMRPSIADRLSQLLYEIEAYLLACTHEEMCKFWKAIAQIRQSLQIATHQSDVPRFLTERRKNRDFCRILEVLADLPYPKLHLSSHLSSQVSDRARFQETQPYSTFGYPHKSFNASLN